MYGNCTSFFLIFFHSVQHRDSARRRAVIVNAVPGVSLLVVWVVALGCGSLKIGKKRKGEGGAGTAAPIRTPLRTAPQPRGIQDACFFIIFSMPFWIDFRVQLGPMLVFNIHPNPSKIDAKRHSIMGFVFISIFDQFGLPTWTPRIPKIILNSVWFLYSFSVFRLI